MLIAYLSDEVAIPERSRIDAHLDECEACLELTLSAHARLRFGAIAEPVPTIFSQPTAVVPPHSAAGPAGIAPSHPQRPKGVVRYLPVPPPRWLMAPLALAAGLALMLVAPDFNRGIDAPLTRGVDDTSIVRITAHQADVRADPSLHAVVVAQLARGTVLDVAGQERDWYRIRLASGGEGWVEQRACR
jgi:hypothetical protein